MRAIVKSIADILHGAVIANSSVLSLFYLRFMLLARWRHYFPRLIQINYEMMFRMKRPWFLRQIWYRSVKYF